LPRLRAVLALGRIAHDGLVALLRAHGRLPAGSVAPRFGHGSDHDLGNGVRLFGTYHPSQQNTFTRRLTPAMLDAVLAAVSGHLRQAAR
jgi:uracil-DNA glycosylase